MTKASYPLGELKALIEKGHWILTVAAADGALLLGLDADDIADCIVNHLSDSHFHKTMPAERMKGLMQDVYRITYQEQRIYLKLQKANQRTVVISFKEQ